MQACEKDTIAPLDPVRDDIALLELEPERSFDDRGLDLEELCGERQELVARQPVVFALGLRLPLAGRGRGGLIPPPARHRFCWHERPASAASHRLRASRCLQER